MNKLNPTLRADAIIPFPMKLMRSQFDPIHFFIRYLNLGRIFSRIELGSYSKEGARGEFAPMVLAMVIGPIFEKSFRQSLLMSMGDFTIFIARPISAFLIICTALLLIGGFLPVMSTSREKLK